MPTSLKPFFSIIVPVHNRQRFIARALHSCLKQEFRDFEIVVVDDGSTDGSAERVLAIKDARVRLMRHSVNRGVGPSRNLGMAAARGEWFVFLDSDDELVAGALGNMYQQMTAVDASVGAVRFMCRDDHGRVSPDPAHADELLDYRGFIEWTAAARGRPSEALPCARAGTFPHIRYADNAAPAEGLYHLDVARFHGVLAAATVVRLYHYDANDRLCAPNARRALSFAPAALANVDALLHRHGDALHAWSPELMSDALYAGALWSLLAGDRRRGIQFATDLLRAARPSGKLCGVVAAGLVHRRLLAWLKDANGASGRGSRALEQAAS